MITIKEYLMLRRINTYLDTKRDEAIRENNGYNNKEVDDLTILVNGLSDILEKLEE